MERLENPHHATSAILVGGTNGKGSVTAMIENIVAATGEYQVGSTISPHLAEITERIRLQGTPLPTSLWIQGVEALKEIVALMRQEPSLGAPSFFELVTALAFWAFRETDRDLAVIEVGLGGRLDATNVTCPEISVITNIGTDHRELLGPDRPSIAREKLGICRPKRFLVTGEHDPQILDIFRAECEKKKSEFIVAAEYPSNPFFKVLESHARGHRLALPEVADPVEFPLPGLHQLDNLAVTLTTVDRLRQNGFEIPAAAVAQGLNTVRWPGRLQWINGAPPVLLDGAHNDEGLRSLLTYLERFPLPRPAHLVLGVLQNKPAAEMARLLAPHVDSLAFVAPQATRALDHSAFDQEIKPTDTRWTWHPTLTSALEAGEKAASILITGSLYLVADYLRLRPPAA